MKKSLLTLFALGMAVVSYSQFTIVSADMPSVGNIIVRQSDTLSVFFPGAAGSGVLWDFTAAIAHEPETTFVVAPSTTPFASDYPTSNLAFTRDNNNFMFLTNSSSDLTVQGLGGNYITGNDVLAFNPELTMYEFPLAYNDNMSDNYAVELETDGSSFGVYKIKFKRSGTVEDTVDGYGTLKTPYGTYEALRVKRHEVAIDSVFIKYVSDLEPWSLFYDSNAPMITYSWLTKEEKLPTVEMTMNATGDTAATFVFSTSIGTFSIEEENYTQAIVAPNPANDLTSIYLPYSITVEKTQFRLTDIHGKVVQSRFVMSGNRIDVHLDALPSGVYIYYIEGGPLPITGKLIKN